MVLEVAIKCCKMLGSVDASTQDMVMKMYNMQWAVLYINSTVKEKDLGLSISADVKVSEQCGIAAAKGKQILVFIRRNVVYKEKQLIMPLYKAIIQPHLEYCIQA